MNFGRVSRLDCVTDIESGIFERGHVLLPEELFSLIADIYIYIHIYIHIYILYTYTHIYAHKFASINLKCICCPYYVYEALPPMNITQGP